MSKLVLDDYVAADEQNDEDSKAEESYSLEKFLRLITLILSNQSTFFREVYNGKAAREIDLQKHLRENNDNIRLCFNEYDIDKSGYLDYMELRELLKEMNLHKQFSRHYNP